jgi:HK97 family phage portal protein
MGVLKNLSDGFKVALGRVRKGAFADAFLKALDIPRDDISNAYEEHTWTYACINVIMRKVASVPFVVASRAKDNEGNQVELPDHPAAKLLANPNPTMTGTELTQGTILSLYLNGEGLWLHEFMGQRTPQEIFLHMDPKASKPVFMEESLPVGWRVPIKGGAGTDFSNDEIVRYRFIDPDDPLRGFAPVDVANLAINQDFKAGKYNLGLLTNQAVPSGIIQVEESAWDEAQLKRIKKQWDREHKGAERQGRIGWLLGGMKFQSIGLAMKDLDYIEGRRFNREEILGVFGVPPAEVGVHEFSNYANAREQGRKFWQNTLIPLLVMYEEALEKQFFQVHYPDVVGFFDLTNVEDLEENLETKAVVAQRLFAMGVPFSDINERLQMGFNTDGRPWLEQGVRGLALVNVGSIQEEPTLAPALPAPAGSVQIFEPTTGRQPRIAKQSRAERRRIFRGNYDASTVQNIQRMRERVRGYFEAEAARVASSLEANYQIILNRNRGAVAGVMKKYVRLKGSIKGKSHDETVEKRKNLFKVLVRAYAKTLTQDIEELVFSIDESKNALRPIADSEISGMLAEGGMSIAEIAGVMFNSEAPGAIDAVGKRVNNIVDFVGSGINIPQESFNRVRESVIASIQEGDSVALASQRIRNLYEGFSDQRALVIAQTEMGYAFNSGAFELYGQAGIPQHEWLSAGDADVRDTHLAAEAQGPIPVGQTFDNGLRYPNDPAGGPEEVVNCRCTTAPVVAAETAIGYYPRKRVARGAKERRIHLTEAMHGR